MSWRLDNRRKFILMSLAVTALLMQGVLDYTKTPVRQRDYKLKLAAAERADRAFAVVRQHRQLNNSHFDLINDPAGTGLIGPEYSQITNARGVLESKLTSLNPNFAGLLVQFFRQANLQPGDPVAIAISGSFPGLNICLLAAMEEMELRPVVITSVGSSMWGANNPDFTWLDMETLFFDKGIFTTRSSAATFGGGNDMGMGLSPSGRQMIVDAIERNGIPLLSATNIEEAITTRMSFYEESARGRPYKIYVNVGGGVASIGSSHNRILLNSGLSFDPGAHNWPRKGTLLLFAEKGIPTVHMLGISGMARDHGLPVAPDYFPQPGEGEIFMRDMYRFPLAAAFLVVYCLACILILAPEIRRGLFDRMTRRRAKLTHIFILMMVVLGTSFISPAESNAATKWRQVKAEKADSEVCLESGSRQLEYSLLDESVPVVYEVNGPRKLKLLTRYIFGEQETEGQSFTIIIGIDGSESMRRTFTPGSIETVNLCDNADTDISALRRAFFSLDKGSHEVAVTVISTGTGQVACRLFRETRRPSTRTVPFAPERFTALTTLQFESGAQNTYYRFESGSPLGLTVQGPTTLQVYTRLDFDHLMNGAMTYSMEVFRDGELWRTFHFDSKKLSSAFYVDQPDILPGTRKKMRITVPKGQHTFEIRCVRPDACGIAAQVRLPAKDLEGKR